MSVISGGAKHRKRTSLALAQGLEYVEVLRSDREHVTLLRFVAPNLHWGHARLFRGNTAQVDTRAAVCTVDQFGQSVGQPSGAHVVNRQNRVILAQCRTAVDDLLAAALNLGITALNRVEIQIGGVCAGCHTGSRTATHPDQHAWAAKLHDQCPGSKFGLECLFGRNVAEATSNHDRLMITTYDPTDILLISAKIAEQVGSSELIVE